MKIYTKTGDKGKTGLYTGQRIDKDSMRVEAYGNVDEINSALGRHYRTHGRRRIYDCAQKYPLW